MVAGETLISSIGKRRYNSIAHDALPLVTECWDKTADKPEMPEFTQDLEEDKFEWIRLTTFFKVFYYDDDDFFFSNFFFQIEAAL